VSTVDVVVVSYNSREHLRDAAAPLAGAPDVHVIVVDSASNDGSLEAVADLPVSTIGLEENRGFGHACNVGWRRGTGEFVLFLNPDARIDEASLRRLAAVAGEDGVGAVAPRIVDTHGALDYSLRRFPRLRSTYAQAFFLHRLAPTATWTDEVERDASAYDQPAAADWVSGACVLVPRRILERLDGFDEGFFLYCEDIDLCRRIRDLGLAVRYEPDAVAVHEGGASMPRASLLPVLAASRVRYARKHQPAHVAALERAGVAVGALTHALLTRGGGEARRGHLRAFAQALSRARS
jgi:GT2 family glycosyltransferase